MKLLLICAGGMSTSMVMKKLEKYADANGIEDFEVSAVGVGAFRDVVDNYDVILLGPQISYKKDDVIEGSGGKPVGVIAPADYAIGNCEHIFAQANSMMS